MQPDTQHPFNTVRYPANIRYSWIFVKYLIQPLAGNYLVQPEIIFNTARYMENIQYSQIYGKYSIQPDIRQIFDTAGYPANIQYSHIPANIWYSRKLYSIQLQIYGKYSIRPDIRQIFDTAGYPENIQYSQISGNFLIQQNIRWSYDLNLLHE